MLIKAVRNILYSEAFYNKIKINLRLQKEAPLHNLCNQNRGYPWLLFQKASLTVEASFCATAFFLALFSLLYLFQMLAGVNQVQMRLAAAVQQYESFGSKFGTVEGFLKQSVIIQWEEEKGICFVKEIEKVPFLGGNFFTVPLYQQMQISDYQGRSMTAENQETAEYVYIAENGRVYHKNRGCVYLNPEIQSMKYQRALERRNRSGGKYKKCKNCCAEVVITGSVIVYITPYGDSDHIDKNCSGLKRTVRKVKLSEIGTMAACSKCSGDKIRNGD